MKRIWAAWALLCALPVWAAMGAVATVFYFTLWAMARLFPDAPGFSFGLLTFGLFLGFLPTCLGWPPLFRSGPGFALAALLSLALLLPGLRKAVEQ